MDDIQGLAQGLVLDDEGDVRLGSALGAGDDADAVPAQDAEQLTGDTAVVLHVLAHDGNRGQFVLPLHGIDGAAGNLGREGLRQHLAGLLRIGSADTEGDTRLGRRLAHQEHVDVLAGQRRENPLVHTDDTHHRRRGKGDERDIVDGGNTLDHASVLPVGTAFVNQGSRGFGVEGILDPDRNLLQAHRIQRRRIHHLGAEVTEFGGFFVGQFVDDVRGLDDPRISRHEAIDIGPDLQYRRVQGRCQDAGGIIGTAPAQGDDVPRGVPGDESGDDGDGAVLPIIGELFGDQFVGALEIHASLIHPDEVQRIVEFGMSHGRRHDQR